MAEHPNKLAFNEGVKYVFQSWTALKLAVEQSWGGVDSEEKRDWMIETITDFFGKNGKKVDTIDIEDILNQIMLDEFQTLLEDDSAYLVAKHLVELFNQCINGNYTEVERLRAKYQHQPLATSNCVKQDSDDEDEDDGEGMDDEEDMDMDDSQNEPSSSSKQMTGPDEDGWETVVRHKK